MGHLNEITPPKKNNRSIVPQLLTNSSSNFQSRFTFSNRISSVVRKSIPKVLQSIPAVWQNLPIIQKSSPIVRLSFPNILKSSPIVRKSSPNVPQNFPIVHKRFPIVRSLIPIGFSITGTIKQFHPKPKKNPDFHRDSLLSYFLIQNQINV